MGNTHGTMPINPGRLRHLITIQQATTTQGPVGRTVVWSDQTTLDGRVSPLSEALQLQQAGERGVATHRVVVRGRHDFTLDQHRFIQAGRIYIPVRPEADPKGDGSWTRVLVRYDPQARL